MLESRRPCHNQKRNTSQRFHMAVKSSMSMDATNTVPVPRVLKKGGTGPGAA